MTSPATILIADDNEANRLLIEDALDDDDFRLVSCNDGQQALAQFEREAPDLVLLDVRMPGLSGIEACQRIRALPGGVGVPIIFLTALRDSDTFDQAIDAGADDYLTKPVRPAELLARVRAALKVRRMSAELQTQYEQLRHQRDDLLRLSLQKERLIAFVVHDLKNPVNSIDLQAQVVLAEEALPTGAREGVEHIRTETQILSRMIHNLLDVSKADEGKLAADVRRVLLDDVLKAVVAELEPDAKRHEVTLAVDRQVPHLRADRELLRRVLANLVENAIRHAPPNSRVELAARAVDGGVELRVRDFGEGIPEALRARIFDAFVQLEDRNARKQGGRGLGLTFCKHAVESHGGRIWIEDAAPGAAFCVWFPDAAEAPQT